MLCRSVGGLPGLPRVGRSRRTRTRPPAKLRRDAWRELSCLARPIDDVLDLAAQRIANREDAADAKQQALPRNPRYPHRQVRELTGVPEVDAPTESVSAPNSQSQAISPSQKN